MYMKEGKLPDNEELAKKVAAEIVLYAVVNDILYYVGTKSEMPTAVLPSALHQQVMADFIIVEVCWTPHLYKSLSQKLWWEHMYRET